MRYLVRLVVVLALFLNACTSEEQGKSETQEHQQQSDSVSAAGPYEFAVSVQEAAENKVLAQLDASKGTLQVFKNGAFANVDKEEGKYIIPSDLPQLGRIMISPEEQILLILDEGEFSGVKQDGKVSITGSSENHNLQWFNDQYESIVQQKEALDQEYRSKGDMRQNTQLQQEYSSKLAQMDIGFEEKLKGFNDTITPSFVGMLATSRLFKENNMEYLAPLIDQYRGKGYANEMVNEYDKRKQTSVGFKAPDFQLQTPSGKSLKLSSLRGKVVLIDFWASWCGPCRKENPNVLRMYNKYKGKGFDIIGVSLDKDASQWEMAIEKDGLIWNHVWDKKGEVSGKYAVNAIPQTFLLDEKGVIIAKNLRGPSLEQKLQEVL